MSAVERQLRFSGPGASAKSRLGGVVFIHRFGALLVIVVLALISRNQTTYQPIESVRTFLDSRHGRHFADDVLNELHAGANLLGASHAAAQRWMDWSIGRQTSKQYGIPKGLPYITGFVIHCEIVEEAMAD